MRHAILALSVMLLLGISTNCFADSTLPFFNYSNQNLTVTYNGKSTPLPAQGHITVIISFPQTRQPAAYRIQVSNAKNEHIVISGSCTEAIVSTIFVPCAIDPVSGSLAGLDISESAFNMGAIDIRPSP